MQVQSWVVGFSYKTLSCITRIFISVTESIYFWNDYMILFKSLYPFYKYNIIWLSCYSICELKLSSIPFKSYCIYRLSLKKYKVVKTIWNSIAFDNITCTKCIQCSMITDNERKNEISEWLTQYCINSSSFWTLLVESIG